MKRSDLLVREAAQKLPFDILSLIESYHLDIWASEHKRYRPVVHELQRAIATVKKDYWKELMDWEGGGYGYMLEGDDIDEELEWCVQRPRELLRHVRYPIPDDDLCPNFYDLFMVPPVGS